MESDPLLENLDGLLPLGVDAGAPSLGSVPAHLPSAVEDLCAALMAEPGIDDVSVRRQVSPVLPVLARALSPSAHGARVEPSCQSWSSSCT
jgi:hypothetical protein